MTTSSRRAFFRHGTALAASLSVANAKLFAAETNAPDAANPPVTLPNNLPSMVEANGHLRFDFGPERMILPEGLQPYMFRTATNSFVLQAQAKTLPVLTARQHYPFAMITIVSRDGGDTWATIPLKPGENGLNLEGGGLQLRDGTIIALDTYITPGEKPGYGAAQLYTSKDDWRTVDGPQDITFDLLGMSVHPGKDDGGRPHNAIRLHRRILELPNGDLLTTIYGNVGGDTKTIYQSGMKHSRVMLARSTDKGHSWKLVSTVTHPSGIGTEGFGEPVLVRISQGPKAGRLLCFMRTGRELCETWSDDGGQTWSIPQPRTFAGLDVNRSELWVDMFRNVKGSHGKLVDENNQDDLLGNVVDPDLIELRSGLLVAAFGMRIPQRVCWPHYQHPWNGNYLAVSEDHGETWPNVVRLTSGVPTTHYMAIEETKNNNEVFVVYDYGFWGYKTRYTYGRTVNVTAKAA